MITFKIDLYLNIFELLLIDDDIDILMLRGINIIINSINGAMMMEQALAASYSSSIPPGTVVAEVALITETNSIVF